MILFGVLTMWGGPEKLIIDILSFPLLTLWNSIRASLAETQSANFLFYGLFFGNSIIWAFTAILAFKLSEKYFERKRAR